MIVSLCQKLQCVRIISNFSRQKAQNNRLKIVQFPFFEIVRLFIQGATAFVEFRYRFQII